MSTRAPEEQHDVRLHVNGSVHEVRVPARRLLSDALRHDCGLTGTHVGCEQGVCGACTVLMDGRPVRACLVLAVQADGSAIRTVESLAADDEELHPLQEAFRDNHGLQCGFCTAGILMSTIGAAESGRSLDDTLTEVLPGHLCRCTGYVNIRRSIRAAWPQMDEVTE
jgi:carbon-monoxide dehydrogenase small subunit